MQIQADRSAIYKRKRPVVYGIANRFESVAVLVAILQLVLAHHLLGAIAQVFKSGVASWGLPTVCVVCVYVYVCEAA